MTQSVTLFKHSLNSVYVVDKDGKKHGVQYLCNNFKINMNYMKRVTKATVNKFLNDYIKQRSNTYVITSPLLSVFANDNETKETHEQRSKRDYIGSFNSYEELEIYINELYELTKNVRKKYHFVNFESSLLDAVSFIKGNEIRLDQKELEIVETLKGETTMKQFKLEVYNETNFTSVEKFNVNELEGAINLATKLNDNEKDHYTIDLQEVVENGYNTIQTYELDEIAELQAYLQQ